MFCKHEWLEIKFSCDHHVTWFVLNQSLHADSGMVGFEPKVCLQVVTCYVLNPSVSRWWHVMNQSSAYRWWLAICWTQVLQAGGRADDVFWTQVLLAGGYLLCAESKCFEQVVTCFEPKFCLQMITCCVLNPSTSSRWWHDMFWTQVLLAGGYLLCWTQVPRAGGHTICFEPKFYLQVVTWYILNISSTCR